MSNISLNEVRLIGNLGAEPVLRKTASGFSVVNFSLATTYKTEHKERTDWHRVVLWGALAERAMRDLKTGSCIIVSGRLSNNKWTDAEGVDRYSTDVVGENMQVISGWKNERQAESIKTEAPAKQTESMEDEDLPF